MTQQFKYYHNIFFVRKKYLWSISIILRIRILSYNVGNSITARIMSIDSAFYTTMYNANSVMYHEPDQYMNYIYITLVILS